MSVKYTKIIGWKGILLKKVKSKRRQPGNIIENSLMYSAFVLSRNDMLIMKWLV
jgi:hypothetical protein